MVWVRERRAERGALYGGLLWGVWFKTRRRATGETRSMVALYRHSFATRPNLTLAFTGASLNSLGDAIAQFTDNAVFVFPLHTQALDLNPTVGCRKTR